ncbi:hypothetical protein Leryth_008908 [Lithospermum erythrorhizon]|nr:hypothetical protein Leryth_008908 [Lithospermum erythrorhizon]
MPQCLFANFVSNIWSNHAHLNWNTFLIVASSPSIAIEILKKQDLILSGRDTPRAFPYSRKELNQFYVAWTDEFNEATKHLRSLSRVELFSGKALTSQESLRARKNLELVDFLKAREGEVVNIGRLAFTTTFNLLGNVLLSKDLIGLEEEIEKNSMKVLFRSVKRIRSSRFEGGMTLNSYLVQKKKMSWLYYGARQVLSHCFTPYISLIIL